MPFVAVVNTAFLSAVQIAGFGVCYRCARCAVRDQGTAEATSGE
jgi:hypothetical protein